MVIVSDGECPHSHEVCRALHPRQLSRNENLRLSLVFLGQCRMARADTPSLTDTSKRALKHACQFCIPVLTSAHLHTCAAYQLNLGRALVALSRSVAWSMRCCSLAICNAIPAVVLHRKTRDDVPHGRKRFHFMLLATFLNLFWSSALISIRPHTKPGTSLVSTCNHFRRRAGSDAHFHATASLPRLPGFL